MTTLFHASLDKKCLKGLHWVYSMALFDLSVIKAALLEDWGTELLIQEERWGRRQLIRLVYPFRFEIQLNTRDNELSFVHRVSAEQETRDKDRKHFEKILTRALLKLKESEDEAGR